MNIRELKEESFSLRIMAQRAGISASDDQLAQMIADKLGVGLSGGGNPPRDVERLVEENRVLKRRFGELEEKLEHSRADAEEAHARVDDLRGKLFAAQRASELAAAECQRVLDREREVQEGAMSRVAEEHRRFAGQVKGKRDELEALKEKQVLLFRENEDLKARLLTAHNELEEMYTKGHNISDLQAALDTKSAKYTEAKLSLRILRAKVENLTAERDTLKKQLRQREEQDDHLVETIAQRIKATILARKNSDSTEAARANLVNVLAEKQSAESRLSIAEVQLEAVKRDRERLQEQLEIREEEKAYLTRRDEERRQVAERERERLRQSVRRKSLARRSTPEP